MLHSLITTNPLPPWHSIEVAQPLSIVTFAKDGGNGSFNQRERWRVYLGGGL